MAAQELTFGGNRSAVLVAAGGRSPETLLAELGLEAGRDRPVIVVCGGADLHDADGGSLLGPAVATAATRVQAPIVDGGTEAGVMTLVGRAAAERGAAVPLLLGVAPAGQVRLPGEDDAPPDRVGLEPHHSHFVLADGAEFGDETPLLIDLAATLAGGAPVVMVVAGGGEVTKEEVLQAVRRGWPVFVVAGSGRTADELARAWESRAASDPVVGEIVRAGDLRVFRGAEPVDLARELAWALQPLEVLKLAWRSFKTYDELAIRARRSFERVQAAILGVGIAATFLALLKDALSIGSGSSLAWIDDWLHWTVVALPIVVAVLVGMAHRLGAGKRWVLLRAAAETIKREIYRFRTGTGGYGEATAAGTAPQELLAAALDAIEAKLLQTEASSAELTPYTGPLPPPMSGASRGDDGLSPLDAEGYLALRVADQLGFYHPKVARLTRKRRRFQAAALVAGGAGAVLAAAGLEIWIGLTTAVAGAALAHLGYLQVESTVVAYNQSAAKLEALRRGWDARPPERRDRKAFEALVDDAETVLGTELGGWVQQMTEALEALQAEQLEAQRRGEVKP